MTNPYLVLDVETSIHRDEPVSGPGGDANPYGQSHAVWLGYGVAGAKAVKLPTDRQELADRTLSLCRTVQADGGPITLVGHNFSFDLHHLFGAVDLLTMDLDYRIWDTMTVEYYLTGQAPEARFSKLSDLMVKYGHQVPKDSEVTALYKQKIGADLIPDELMEPYTRNDIAGTAHVYRAQMAEVDRLGIREFVEEMLDAQLLFTAMEQNGLPVNPQAVQELDDEKRDEDERVADELTAMVHSRLPGLLQARTPLGDAQTKAAILGGEYPTKVTKEIGRYKNGKPKFKTEIVMAQVGPGPGAESVTTPKTFDKDVVATLINATSGWARDQLLLVQEHRLLHKFIGTYVDGYLRRTDGAGIMRCSYNQTATPTGRVSASNPNLQNLPKR